MTFTIPEEIAKRLIRSVHARDRSRYVTDAIAERLRAREQRLIHACEVANREPEVRAVEREWDALRDFIAEPWTDAPSR